MKYYCGLDVSLNTTAICVVSGHGSPIAGHLKHSKWAFIVQRGYTQAIEVGLVACADEGSVTERGSNRNRKEKIRDRKTRKSTESQREKKI